MNNDDIDNDGFDDDDEIEAFEAAFFDAVAANLRTLGFNAEAADRAMALVAEAARTAGGEFLIGFRAPGAEDVMIVDRFADLFED